jgi:hypothetical protein
LIFFNLAENWWNRNKREGSDESNQQRNFHIINLQNLKITKKIQVIL